MLSAILDFLWEPWHIIPWAWAGVDYCTSLFKEALWLLFGMYELPASLLLDFGATGNGMGFHHTTQNGAQLKTYQLFISGIFHLVFSDHSSPWLNENADKWRLLYYCHYLHSSRWGVSGCWDFIGVSILSPSIMTTQFQMDPSEHSAIWNENTTCFFPRWIWCVFLADEQKTNIIAMIIAQIQKPKGIQATWLLDINAYLQRI